MHGKPPSGAQDISRANQPHLVVQFSQVVIQITGTLPGLTIDGAKRSIRQHICPIVYSAGMHAADRNVPLACSSANKSKDFVVIEEVEVWLCGKLCFVFLCLVQTLH